MDWHNNGATLIAGGEHISVEAAEYSSPCTIESDIICLDSIETLRAVGLSGKIAVLHGNLCKEPLMPKSFEFYNPDEHKEIIALLEEKSPAAIITVCPNREHIIQDGDFIIPCAVIYGDIPNVFLKGDVRAKLTINTERIPATAHNVIANHGNGSEKICFSAHIDTKPSTSGALDNASGVSVLLALAETLANKEYPFQIEIVFFNGEDYYSNPGEMAYAGSLSQDYKLASCQGQMHN